MRAALLLVAALAACRGGGTEPYAGSGAPVGASIDVPASTVTLHEAGGEQRRELRYNVGNFSRDIQFAQELGQDVLSHQTIEWHCSPCTYLLSKFAMESDSPMTRSELQGIHGRVTLVDNTRAAVSVAQSNVHVDPDPTEYMLVFLVPLPREPVGVGATWAAEQADMRTEYKLLELTDTTASVHVDRHVAGWKGRHWEGTFAVTFADPVARGMLVQRITREDGGEDRDPSPVTFTFQ